MKHPVIFKNEFINMKWIWKTNKNNALVTHNLETNHKFNFQKSKIFVHMLN